MIPKPAPLALTSPEYEERVESSYGRVKVVNTFPTLRPFNRAMSRDGRLDILRRQVRVTAWVMVGMDADEIERARPDTTLSSNFISECTHSGSRTFKHHAFQTKIMIEMDQRR